MLNKFFSLVFIFIFIFPKSLFAEEQKFDYQHLTAGTCLSTDGFFFTEQGMVSLVVNTREKIRLATVDLQKQLDLLNIDLTTCSDSKNLELRIQKQMYENQLEIKQNVIKSYQEQAYINNYILTGSIILSLTVGFFAAKLFISK